MCDVNAMYFWSNLNTAIDVCIWELILLREIYDLDMLHYIVIDKGFYSTHHYMFEAICRAISPVQYYITFEIFPWFRPPVFPNSILGHNFSLSLGPITILMRTIQGLFLFWCAQSLRKRLFSLFYHNALK